MKKIVIVVAATLLLGACLPFSLTPNPQPPVDIAGTVDVNLKTAVAQTLTAQPTPTTVALSDTPTGLPAASATETATDLPTPNLTTTPATATGIPANSTSVTTAVAPGAATLVPTLTIRLYGTLPPAVPFGYVTLINKSKAEAYISLQVTNSEGGPTILEYPVAGTVRIKAPTGYYLYVAWVGGNKMVGNFSLHESDGLSITLYKDKIVINNTMSYP